MAETKIALFFAISEDFRLSPFSWIFEDHDMVFMNFEVSYDFEHFWRIRLVVGMKSQFWSLLWGLSTQVGKVGVLWFWLNFHVWILNRPRKNLEFKFLVLSMRDVILYNFWRTKPISWILVNSSILVFYDQRAYVGSKFWRFKPKISNVDFHCHELNIEYKLSLDSSSQQFWFHDRSVCNMNFRCAC